MLDLTGCWAGNYVLGPQYKYPHTFKVPFIVDIVGIGKGKEFSGELREDVSNGGIDDLATINGSQYGPRIEFIKSYTKYHYHRDGELVVDPDRAPLDISYFAKFDEKTGIFLGNWYIRPPHTTAIHYYGVWEMRRSNTAGFSNENVDLPDIRSDFRIDGRYVDLTFKVTEHNSDGDYHILTALATYKFHQVGFVVKIPSKVDMVQIDGADLKEETAAEIIFQSLGERSDRLMETMTELFHLSARSKAKPVVHTKAFSLSRDVASLAVTGHHDYGLILNSSEDKFVKYHLSVDLINNIIQLKEKDAWHRSSIISAFAE